MFKYNFSYKYFKLKYKNLNLIIELSKDNTLGKMIYSAKTNYMFRDKSGDWGHACGVGSNEDEALKMCLGEVREFLEIDNNSKLADFLFNTYLPQKVVFLNESNAIVLFAQNVNKNIEILTSCGIKEIDLQTDLIDFLTKNIKEYCSIGVKDTSSKFLTEHHFENIFDNLTCKYENIIKNDEQTI